MLTLAVNIYLTGFLVAFFVLISVMLMLVVLIQRPQGGGLSEAFGSGAGSGHTAFGAKTGDALTTATIVVFLLFIGFAIALNYIVGPDVAKAPAPEVVPAQQGGARTTGGDAEELPTQDSGSTEEGDAATTDEQSAPDETTSEATGDATPEGAADQADTPAETPADTPAETEPAPPEGR